MIAQTRRMNKHITGISLANQMRTKNPAEQEETPTTQNKRTNKHITRTSQTCQMSCKRRKNWIKTPKKMRIKTHTQNKEIAEQGGRRQERNT